MKHLSFLLGILVSLLSAATIWSQVPAPDPASTGTTFIVAFPDTTTNSIDPRFPNRISDTIALMIYSAVDNEVDISSPNGYQNKVRPRARGFEVVYLNNAKNRAFSPIAFQTNQRTNTTFQIKAKFPITLYCYYTTKFGGEAFTPIPVERWGMEYYAAGTPGMVVRDMKEGLPLAEARKNIMAPSEVLIVAAFDNTKVGITAGPTTIFMDYPKLLITLNAGECYQLQTFVDTFSLNLGGTQPDIGGTNITSDKPIGVVSGNTRQRGDTAGSLVSNNSVSNMMIEWLAPTEQMGQEFVFTPTWDTLRLTGQPGEDTSKKREREYIRIYGTSPDTTRIFYDKSPGVIETTLVLQGHLREIVVEGPTVHRIRTDKPAQVMKHTPGVLRLKSSTPSGTPGEYLGANYDAWGGYMMELTPREQWGHVACFHTPDTSYGFQSFVNIVAPASAQGKILNELGQTILFNRGAILGTDLLWGTYPITSGLNHCYYATDTSRFSAVVYGLRPGFEEFTSSTREYHESVALSYGYPVNPLRRVVAQPDSIVIDTTTSCNKLTLHVRVVNNKPVGLQSIRLDPSVSTNATIVYVDPTNELGIVGRTEALVEVIPIDPLKDASAVVVITDRTDNAWRVDYQYHANIVELKPASIIDYGPVSLNECKDTVVTITNPGSNAIVVTDVKFVLGDQGFSILSTDPATLPTTLAPGDSMHATIRFCPTIKNTLYIDSMSVLLGCVNVTIPIRGESVVPCIYVDDLTFGRIILGVDPPRTLELKICNLGRGELRFTNPSGGAVLTRIANGYSVPQSEIDNLRDNVVLGFNECTTIHVTFTPTKPGVFWSTAKFWSTATCVRDTSNWNAVVVDPTSAVDGDETSDRSGNRHLQSRPNPASQQTEVTFSIAHAAATELTAYDLLGRPIALLVDTRLPEGEHRIVWDTSKLPTGVYHLRLVSGEFRSTLEVLVTR